MNRVIFATIKQFKGILRIFYLNRGSSAVGKGARAELIYILAFILWFKLVIEEEISFFKHKMLHINYLREEHRRGFDNYKVRNN